MDRSLVVVTNRAARAGRSVGGGAGTRHEESRDTPSGSVTAVTGHIVTAQ